MTNANNTPRKPSPYHLKKLYRAIELANNAYLVVDTGFEVIFCATKFAAEGIARTSGQLVEHVESDTYVVRPVAVARNTPGRVAYGVIAGGLRR